MFNDPSRNEKRDTLVQLEKLHDDKMTLTLIETLFILSFKRVEWIQTEQEVNE